MSDDLIQRAYRGKRDTTIKAVIEYYRGHIQVMKSHWPTFRRRHEEWLTENFGSEAAKQIMDNVRDWKREQW